MKAFGYLVLDFFRWLDDIGPIAVFYVVVAIGLAFIFIF